MLRHGTKRKGTAMNEQDASAGSSEGRPEFPFDETPYPFQELLGFRILEWEDGRARFQLPLGEHLHNRSGIPHGGVYASMLDTAMGFSGSYTGSSTVRRMAMTLSITVNYLSRPTGKILIAEGRRLGGGKSTFFAEAKITDSNGELVATSTGTFRCRNMSADEGK